MSLKYISVKQVLCSLSMNEIENIKQELEVIKEKRQNKAKDEFKKEIISVMNLEKDSFVFVERSSAKFDIWGLGKSNFMVILPEKRGDNIKLIFRGIYYRNIMVEFKSSGIYYGNIMVEFNSKDLTISHIEIVDSVLGNGTIENNDIIYELTENGNKQKDLIHNFIEKYKPLILHYEKLCDIYFTELDNSYVSIF